MQPEAGFLRLWLYTNTEIMQKLVILTLIFLAQTIDAINAQSKTLGEFDRIAASGNVSVMLSKGSPRAEYRILKGEESGLTIEVRGGELTVKTESNYKFWKKDHTKAEVTVYYDKLQGLDCSAGARITAEQSIVSDRFDLEASSGSECELSLETTGLNADASSGGKITLTGKSNEAVFDASSGAAIEAYDLVTVKSLADVSSGAKITIHVTKELKADASSGGSIRYKGNPTRTDLHSSVAGSIKSY